MSLFAEFVSSAEFGSSARGEHGTATDNSESCFAEDDSSDFESGGPLDRWVREVTEDGFNAQSQPPYTPYVPQASQEKIQGKHKAAWYDMDDNTITTEDMWHHGTAEDLWRRSNQPCPQDTHDSGPPDFLSSFSLLPFRDLEEHFGELGCPAPQKCEEPEKERDQDWLNKSTVMLTDLASDYTQPMLVQELNDSGFLGTFDFVCVPSDRTSRDKGYAIINLVHPNYAWLFKMAYTGRQMQHFRADRGPCVSVQLAPIQGLEGNYTHFANEMSRCGALQSVFISKQPSKTSIPETASHRSQLPTAPGAGTACRFCTQCGTRTRPGSRFCTQCGSGIVRP